MLSTSEIVELEKRLFKYRLKQKLHYVYFSLAILIISGLTYYFYPKIEPFFKDVSMTSATETTSVKQTLDVNITTQPINTMDANVTQPALNNDDNKTEETLLLQLPTITQSSMSKKYSPPPEISKTASGIQEEETNTKLFMRKPSENSQEESFYRNKEDQIDGTLLPPPPLEDIKPKGIIKIETHEINSIQYLKEKFDSTHNIVFALMLAEEYYLNKNYNESNKWALIANNIDAGNEKSWLWFAKSKYKLGHKDDAILALKAYLKNNKSSAVESLLNQITVGEMVN